MAKAVRRRQTTAQLLATLFGGLLLLVLVVFLVGTLIQGSRRTVSDSPMQRVLSAQTAPYHFISDTAKAEADTVYVSGHFGGVPSQRPQNEQEWHDLAARVAQVYAEALKGLSYKTVEVSFYDQGELKARVSAPIR